MIPGYALYQKKLFVGRKEELKLVNEKVREALRGGVGYPSAIHWYGIPGIGKTWLLAEIARQYREQPKVAVLEHNFAQDGFLSATLVGDVKDRTQGGVVSLILLEAADYLPEREWLRVEKEVLEPILLTNRAIVVVTSRRRIHRWNRFQVRRRILAEGLGPLSDPEILGFDDVLDLSRRWGCDQARAERVSWLACGHPYAVQALAQTPDKDPAVVISEVISRIIEEAPVEIQPIVEASAPLRVFDVEPLRSVLAEAVNASYSEASDGKMLDLIRDLQEAKLVEWNAERSQYMVVPPLRCLLHHKLELTRLDELRRWHRAALDFLLGRLQRRPTFAATLLREIPYHMVWARPEQAAEELGRLLDTYLVPENFEGDEAHELLQALRADIDLRMDLEVCYRVVRARVEKFCREIA